MPRNGNSLFAGDNPSRRGSSTAVSSYWKIPLHYIQTKGEIYLSKIRSKIRGGTDTFLDIQIRFNIRGNGEVIE
jgi:hypothetical protein